MKNIIAVILALLVLAPPIQAHNDVVVYNTIELHEDFDEVHEEIHHQNDSQDDKNKDHHHHCTIVTLSLEYIVNAVFTFSVLPLIEVREQIIFFRNSYNNSYLNEIFQPPQF